MMRFKLTKYEELKSYFWFLMEFYPIHFIGSARKQSSSSGVTLLCLIQRNACFHSVGSWVCQTDSRIHQLAPGRPAHSYQNRILWNLDNLRCPNDDKGHDYTLWWFDSEQKASRHCLRCKKSYRNSVIHFASVILTNYLFFLWNASRNLHLLYSRSGSLPHHGWTLTWVFFLELVYFLLSGLR